MKLSEWKNHIDELIEKYGDIDIQYCNTSYLENEGLIIGKEFTFKTKDGELYTEFNSYDETLDSLFLEWNIDDELVDVKYLFDLKYKINSLQ